MNKTYKCPYCKTTNLLFTIPTRALFSCNPDGTIGDLITSPEALEYITRTSDKPQNTNEKIQFFCPDCHSEFKANPKEEGNYTVGKVSRLSFRI